MGIDIKKFEQTRNEVEKSSFTKRNIAINRSGWRLWRYHLLRPLLKRRYWRYQRLNPHTPWITPPIITALERLLDKEMLGFEFGSGRSTLFYAQRIQFIWAIEHDEAWYAKVYEDISKKQIGNIGLRLVKPEKEIDYPNISSENHIDLTSQEYPVKDDLFKCYVDSLDEFENEYFDFVAVDGRARVSCALKAMGKLKPGGILLLDNSERKRYASIHRELAKWPKIVGTTGLTDTTLWLKPQ